MALRKTDCILRLKAFQVTLCEEWLRCTFVVPNVLELVESYTAVRRVSVWLAWCRVHTAHLYYFGSSSCCRITCLV